MKVQTETTAESLNKTIAEASGLAKAAMEALPGSIKAKNPAPEGSGDKPAGSEEPAGGATPAGEGTDGGAAPPE